MLLSTPFINCEILTLSSYLSEGDMVVKYSKNLLSAMTNQFGHTFSLKVCALKREETIQLYPSEVTFQLNVNDLEALQPLASAINTDTKIKIILIQHEFGLFPAGSEEVFFSFIEKINKPTILVFHTLLPNPEPNEIEWIRFMSYAVNKIVVMNYYSAQLLQQKYGVECDLIEIIPYGTHLIHHKNRQELKRMLGLHNRKVLATFGLLSPGKSIETTLRALPTIIQTNPDVCFLIIGKTHPSALRTEGEQYRSSLKNLIEELHLEHYIRFVDDYILLNDLLDYLQLCDICLFTSKDTNQVISDTFTYAMSCGCPIISTPVPYALELLSNGAGVIIEFQNSDHLAEEISNLLNHEALQETIHRKALQKMVPMCWENVAIAYAKLFSNLYSPDIPLQYDLPDIELYHFKKLSTRKGMIQFSQINQPDLETGYTLDDNARALVALCMHYERTQDKVDLPYLETYLSFIEYCWKEEGYFLNYVDKHGNFTAQNWETNLEDANGRALWSLGFIVSKASLLPPLMLVRAKLLFEKATSYWNTIYSTRAMAFAIKGIHYYLQSVQSLQHLSLLETLANRLKRMYMHEAEINWTWFESYLTYGNSVLPDAMLCAFLQTGNTSYQSIAKESFDFLLAQTFKDQQIKVISNQQWLMKGGQAAPYGEQPIDVAYTVLALARFKEIYPQEGYDTKMQTAFSWFLGNNHLQQIIYNPCTGGCYDGLEEFQINLNQGAESTVSYLMARLSMEG